MDTSIEKRTGWHTFHDDEEWAFFRSIYKYIGSFCIVNGSENGPSMVYLDENAAQILRMNYEDVKDGVLYDRFMNWFMNHTEAAAAGGKMIYSFTAGAEHFLLKINKQDTSYGSVYFIQNFSDAIFDSQDAMLLKGRDARTGMLNREAFLRKIMDDFKDDRRSCLAMIHINGIENLNHWYGFNYSDRGLICAARTLMHFASDNIILGVMSLKEFAIYFSDMDSASVYQILQDICSAMDETVVSDDFGETIMNGEHLLSVSIGYCPFTASRFDDQLEVRALLDKATFALTEARMDRSIRICPFTEENYRRDKEKYGDVLKYIKLTSDNLFAYHFQPIVDARSGDIFAYELLMRTQEGISLTPDKILEIAGMKNQLYDIERMTMSNAFHIMQENRDVFKNCRLFVNSIPAHILSDEHYEELKSLYGDVFDKIVIEFTEQTEVSDLNLKVIQRRCRDSSMGLAIDDYGTGYSNVSSLLRYAANYVKIDRSLLTQIHIDSKKQHLVANIIQFAHKNGILVLAEGIETPMELRSVIHLGADLIQGFYTAKPEKEFVRNIDPVVRNEIRTAYKEYEGTLETGIYSISNEDEIRLCDIDPKVYNEILVNENELIIDGTGSNNSTFTIRTQPNSKSHIILKNTRLKGVENLPSIILGENSSLILEILERNTISASYGIMVPENSKLKIIGNGSLSIACDYRASYGIGNDASHSHGNITVDMGGQLSLLVNGTDSIGIGSGYNAFNSYIKICNSDIDITITGENCLCIGSLYDNSNIRISNSHIGGNAHGVNICGIGSHHKGSTCTIDDSTIALVGSGDIFTGIGISRAGFCELDIRHSNVSITVNAKDACCIGGRGSITSVKSFFSKIRLNCQGEFVTGIGDSEGRGNMSLRETNFEFAVNSTHFFEIGTKYGDICEIVGGSKKHITVINNGNLK